MLKCVIPNWFLAWRNLDSRVIDESPTEGFTPDDLSNLYYRCAKLCNIAVVVFVCSGLNASCYNLLANHTAILVAEDTCLPDLTTNKVICDRKSPPMRLRKLKNKVSEVGSSVPSAKRVNDVKGSADNVDDVDDQDDAHYHSADNVNDLVRSFDLVQSFDLVRSFDFVESFDLVWSFDQRTRKRVDPSVILLLHVFPIDPDSIRSFVVHKTLIFLGMLVLLKKLEEDAPDCTRVDDDGVEFSPKSGDYFPTMGDETKKDKCSIFLLLLIICLVLMQMERVSYLRSIQRRSRIRFLFLLLDSLNKEIFEDLTVYEDALDPFLSLAEILKIETMSPLEPLNQYRKSFGIRHFLQVYVDNFFQKLLQRVSHFVPGANIEPNKADPEEVADLDLDQLPTSAFVVLVSSIVPISNLSHKTFAHTSVLNASKVKKTTKTSIPSGV
ncbi:hypothetical protein Tco_0480474 [Tanacetum coccineum]